MEALTQYNFVSIYFKKFIKQLQSYLVSINTDEKESEFYLDGKFDLTYDRDPGKMSWDCTESRPLAFEDPNIDIFNIKVFKKNKEHIGNIYLLSTETDNGEKVWHLEAIQVPSKIEWSEWIEKIIKELGIEAKKKNIDMITVNTDITHMSNYDYIQDAILSYIEKINLGTKKIKVPEVDEEEYSAFQGNGNVYIVWKNK